MRRIISILSVLVLVCFSFYYTEQVAKFVRRKDPIYQEILKVAESYQVSPVNATIDDETVIPGNYGKQINIESSYANMKRLGKYNESLLVYQNVVPEISLNKQYDKYIVSGNKERSIVSLIFAAPDITFVEEVGNILRNHEISATFFVDGSWVNERMEVVETLSKDGNQIENLGYNGVYSKEKLIWTNNLLESITKIEPKYCYTKYRNSSILDLCGSYYMYTVRPTIITGSYPFSTVKKGLNDGSIIHFDLTSTMVKELSTIISYIKQKGYDITTLSDSLSEKQITEK